MTRARVSSGNPANIVLVAEELVVGGAPTVDLGVAPAIEEIATPGPTALRYWRWPQLLEVASAVVVLWSMIQTSLYSGTLNAIWSNSAS